MTPARFLEMLDAATPDELQRIVDRLFHAYLHGPAGTVDEAEDGRAGEVAEFECAAVAPFDPESVRWL